MVARGPNTRRHARANSAVEGITDIVQHEVVESNWQDLYARLQKIIQSSAGLDDTHLLTHGDWISKVLTFKVECNPNVKQRAFFNKLAASEWPKSPADVFEIFTPMVVFSADAMNKIGKWAKEESSKHPIEAVKEEMTKVMKARVQDTATSFIMGIRPRDVDVARSAVEKRFPKTPEESEELAEGDDAASAAGDDDDADSAAGDDDDDAGSSADDDEGSSSGEDDEGSSSGEDDEAGSADEDMATAEDEKDDLKSTKGKGKFRQDGKGGRDASVTTKAVKRVDSRNAMQVDVEEDDEIEIARHAQTPLKSPGLPNAFYATPSVLVNKDADVTNGFLNDSLMDFADTGQDFILGFESDSDAETPVSKPIRSLSLPPASQSAGRRNRGRPISTRSTNRSANALSASHGAGKSSQAPKADQATRANQAGKANQAAKANQSASRRVDISKMSSDQSLKRGQEEDPMASKPSDRKKTRIDLTGSSDPETQETLLDLHASTVKHDFNPGEWLHHASIDIVAKFVTSCCKDVQVFDIDLPQRLSDWSHRLAKPLHLAVHSSTTTLFIVFNHRKHWFTARVDLALKQWLMYDSLPGHVKADQQALALAVVNEILGQGANRWASEGWQYSLQTTPAQTNGSDCGVFAALFMLYMTFLPISFLTDSKSINAGIWRQVLKSILLEEVITIDELLEPIATVKSEIACSAAHRLSTLQHLKKNKADAMATLAQLRGVAHLLGLVHAGMPKPPTPEQAAQSAKELKDAEKEVEDCIDWIRSFEEKQKQLPLRDEVHQKAMTTLEDGLVQAQDRLHTLRESEEQKPGPDTLQLFKRLDGPQGVAQVERLIEEVAMRCEELMKQGGELKKSAKEEKETMEQYWAAAEDL